MKQERINRVHVHFNEAGQIVSIVELGEQEGRGAGVFTTPSTGLLELELSKEQLSIPLVALHASSRVDLSRKDRDLSPSQRRGSASDRSSSERVGIAVTPSHGPRRDKAWPQSGRGAGRKDSLGLSCPRPARFRIWPGGAAA
jgi:hypothetical protein